MEIENHLVERKDALYPILDRDKSENKEIIGQFKRELCELKRGGEYQRIINKFNDEVLDIDNCSCKEQ